MVGLLTNSESEKEKKQKQTLMLNQQALKNFAVLFYGSKRAKEKEKQALAYWQQVEKIGFPHFRNENWHYTPLTNILNTKYQLNNNNNTGYSILNKEQLKKIAITIDSWQIIMIDGYFIPELSSRSFGPYQIHMLDENIINLPTPIINNEIFLYLTESLSAQPLLIILSANNIAEKPLYILNITSGLGLENTKIVHTSHYRYHLEIGSNSKAKVIEHFISLDNNSHFTGARLTANIGNNSHLNHIKLSVENNKSNHIAHNDILSGDCSTIKSTCLLTGSALLRHQTSVKLNGICSKLELNSFVLPKNNEIIDCRTYLEHNKPFCESKQLHKTIALNESKAIFNGMIRVAAEARKTYSQMTNKNLLLGKHAEINTKPQLEIYADDVKCSHGATIGDIDTDHLFYFCSRGININQAKHILMSAFASEIIETLTLDSKFKLLGEQIMHIIYQRLA